MDEKEIYLHTEHLAVGYQKPLIEEIEIAVARGEILTLIGPNGAGKSTILKSITKQLSFHKGIIWIDKKSLTQMSGKDVAKKMAVVMTKQIHSELMTCQDVVGTGRYPYTGKLGILGREDQEKVWEALRLVQAEELAWQEFSKVSDGQRQRIMLAKAICQEPELIVLDEPTSFLDIRHKLELLYILKQMVREKKIAVIMSLHELDLAQRISDKVVCVKDGKIDRCQRVEEVFAGNYITELYGIEKGSFSEKFGTVELPQVEGAPQVFVIGGNGSGIPLYRRLQRQGIPFAAGILHENDVEYGVASSLAVEVVSEQAFEEISEKTFQKAVELMEKCSRVVCTLHSFGTMNGRNQELLKLAEGQGKAEEK
ncbi:MAG: ABC transporter ATP-binding protein [Lachnospiraceae bacterium]|nr:ABC transporter ATP-binding protein [Lachnospiraceae bacterium]